MDVRARWAPLTSSRPAIGDHRAIRRHRGPRPRQTARLGARTRRVIGRPPIACAATRHPTTSRLHDRQRPLPPADLVFRPDIPAIGTDWLASKNAPTFSPTGPYLVPAAFVDPARTAVCLRLNGEVMQDGRPANDRRRWPGSSNTPRRSPNCTRRPLMTAARRQRRPPRPVPANPVTSSKARITGAEPNATAVWRTRIIPPRT